MNIQTASIYAQQGYAICRPHWTEGAHILAEKDSVIGWYWLTDDREKFCLEVDECLADDWEICHSYVTDFEISSGE